MTRTDEKGIFTAMQNFRLSGPTHLTYIDWENAHHRRCVAASLVKGVYVMESERQEKLAGSEALADPWWVSFHFTLHRILRDNDAKSSIFGAIYEYKPSASHQNSLVQNVPRFVIAFRGTLLKPDSVLNDLKLDFDIILNKLHRRPRIEIGVQAVKDMVDRYGDSNVWIAGHSLGAAIGIIAGTKMAKAGVFMESFIFNPPFVSVLIERIKYEKIKEGLHVTSIISKGLLAKAVKGKQQKDPFLEYCGWIPSLFVNPSDHICSAYIGYFERRKKMEDKGFGSLEKLASQNSYKSLVKRAIGKNAEEPDHLIPSANLNKNITASKSFFEAHSIQQWWKNDQQLDSVIYEYK